jgi:hypothetical protein
MTIERGVNLDSGIGRDNEDLFADLRERLEDSSIEEEIGRRKLGDVIAGICRDLGMKPSWRLWEETSWFAEEGWHFPEDEAPEETEPDEIEPAKPDPGPPKGFLTRLQERYGKEEFPDPPWMRNDPPASDSS